MMTEGMDLSLIQFMLRGLMLILSISKMQSFELFPTRTITFKSCCQCINTKKEGPKLKIWLDWLAPRIKVVSIVPPKYAFTLASTNSFFIKHVLSYSSSPLRHFEQMPLLFSVSYSTHSSQLGSEQLYTTIVKF